MAGEPAVLASRLLPSAAVPHRAAPVALSLLAVWAGQGASAQEVSGRTEVRALGVMVAVEPGVGLSFRHTSRGALAPEDFRIERDGERLAVAAVEPFDDGPPWRLLVYVDAALSSTELLRAATGLLAAQAEELVRLGDVEVVVADPDPRLRLAATRDHRRLAETLAGLSLQATGADSLRRLRSEVVAADGVDRELAAAASACEVEIVVRQTDRLLTWVGGTAPERGARALLLVSGGFDEDPAVFYGALEDRQGPTGLATLRPDLSAGLARTIAAEGWVAFALRRPAPDPLPRRWGLRRSLLVRLDGNWDPERAEAYFELGESLIAQEKWRRAESALRSAAYHYYAQPKLRPRQAEALLRLAYVLRRQGRDLEADGVSRKAVELAPHLASRVEVAGLLDPVKSLATLAEATSGGLIATPEELREAVAGLRRRVKLAYQVRGPGNGEPLPLEVTYLPRGFAALAPRWSSNGSPPLLAAARARRMLDDDLAVAPPFERRLSPATLEASCRLARGPRSGGDRGSADVEIALDPGLGESWSGVAARLRLAVASRLDGTWSTVLATSPAMVWEPGAVLGASATVELPVDEPDIAVVVEEMTTGRWFASFVACEEAESGGLPGEDG